MKKWLKKPHLIWVVTLFFLVSFSQEKSFAFSSDGGKASKKKVSKPVVKKTKASGKKAKKKKTKNKKKDPFYKSSLMEKIYKRQAKRMKKIDEFKKKGVIGEADSGLLKVRGITGLGKKDKALMEKIVKVENSDRQKIFRESVKGIKPTKNDLIFMRRRYFEFQRASDLPGTYFYQADNWHKKN